MTKTVLDCRCEYPAKPTEGKLLFLDVYFEGENHNDILNINGYDRNNPLNYIFEGVTTADSRVFRKSKESFIAVVNNKTVIPSTIIMKFKGIVFDNTEDPFSFRGYHHSLIIAREAGMAIVGIKDIIKKLKPGQKVRLEPKVPVGKVIILEE